MPLKYDASDIANAGSYLTRQLEQATPKIYEKKYASLWADAGEHLPIGGELEAGATAVLEDIVEAVGEAAELSDLTDDFPTVTVSEDEDKFNVHTFIAGYNYSVPQMLAARKAEKNIDTRRIRAVDRVLKQRVHETLVFGSVKRGSDGLFNHPDVTISTPGYDANTADWQDAIDFVSAEIADIEDRNVLAEGVAKLMVPNKLWHKWSNIYQAGTSSRSALEAITQTYNIEVVRVNECRAAFLERFGVRPAGTNEDRVVFLPNDPDAVDRLGSNPSYMPPQLYGLVYKVCAYLPTSATMVHMPDSITYVDIPQVV